MKYTLVQPCARCGALLDPDNDLNPEVQRVFELHLQSCRLAVLVEIESRLAELGSVIEERLVHVISTVARR